MIGDSMTIQLLIAPSGAGKTEFCIQEIYSIKRGNPFLPVCVIVPESYPAYLFRKRLASKSGLIGIKVGTFFSFYKEILEINHQFFPVANQSVKNRVLNEAIDECFNTNKISYYSKIINFPGFRQELIENISTLKRNMIFPEAFLEYGKKTDKGLLEYAEIYSIYQKYLNELKIADSEGLSWLAVDFMNQNLSWRPSFPLIIIDGFDSFTKPQLEFISLLEKRVDKIVITLPGDSTDSRSIYNRFIETQKRIKSFSKVEEIAIENQYYSNPVMNHVNQNFGLSNRKEIDGKDYISFIETKSHSDEIREALRWIKKKVIREGLDLNKTALILPEKHLYSPYLELIAEEFKIPINFSNKNFIAQTPLFEYISTLLNLPIDDFDRRALLDTLQSTYFDFSSLGFDEHSSLLLDKISIQHQILKSKDIWLECLTIQENKVQKKLEIDEEFSIIQLPVGLEAKKLKNALISLFDKLDCLKQNKSLSEWIIWLETLLMDLKFIEQLSLKEDCFAHQSLQQLWQDMLSADEILGSRMFGYSEFVKTLEIEASQYKVSNDEFTKKEGVQVLSPQLSRGLRFDAVAVVGLSEGIFPKKQKADPFLNEVVRKDLDIDSAIDNYQWSLCYQVFTRSDQYLLLTRPFMSSDGTQWEPSPFWDNIINLFLNKPIKQSENYNRNIQDAASVQEILAWTMDLDSLPPAIRAIITGEIEKVTLGRETLQKRLNKNDLPSFNNIQELITNKIDQQKVWSASRIESYIQCPYKYYVSQILEIEEKKDPALGIDPLILGNIYHRILEIVFEKTQDPQSLDLLIETLEKESPKVFEKAEKEEAFRPSKLWDIEKIEIVEKLKLTIEALHSESRLWTPIGLEQKFGFDDQPNLKLKLDQRTIDMRGYIDRVDQNEQGDLRIIDYKSGSSHQSQKDLENGTRLQLPIYGLVAQEALGLGSVKEGFYWQVNQAKKSSLKLEKYGFDKAVKIAKAHINVAVEGIYSSNFEIKPLTDGCPSYCPAVSWCWHYKKGRKF